VKSLKAQAAARGIGRKASTTVNNVKISTRRPKPYEWVRVHPDADAYQSSCPLSYSVRKKRTTTKRRRWKNRIYTQSILTCWITQHLLRDATKQCEYSLAIHTATARCLSGSTLSDKENSWLDSEEENIAKARTTLDSPDKRRRCVQPIENP